MLSVSLVHSASIPCYYHSRIGCCHRSASFVAYEKEDGESTLWLLQLVLGSSTRDSHSYAISQEVLFLCLVTTGQESILLLQGGENMFNNYACYSKSLLHTASELLSGAAGLQNFLLALPFLIQISGL